VNLAENAAVDDAVQTVAATDADSGIDGKSETQKTIFFL
jgi:hypothetical protein